MSEAKRRSFPGPARSHRGRSCIWAPHIVSCIATFMPPNEVAGTLRLVNKAAAEQFKQFRKIRLSQASPAAIFLHRWGAPGAMADLTYTKRVHLLCLTAASGILANLQVALRATDIALVPDIFDAAAEAGQVHICQHLLDIDCPESDTVAAAVRSGSRPMVEWALGQCRDEEEMHSEAWGAACVAAAAGHVELLMWLLMLLFPVLDGYDMQDLMEGAVKGCPLVLVQRIYLDWYRRNVALDAYALPGLAARWPPPPPELMQMTRDDMLVDAAASPTPDWRDKVEWLETQLRAARSAAVVEAAAVTADAAERLAWLAGRGYPLTPTAAFRAALAGRREAVEWLLAAGVDAPVMLLAVAAAAGGHMELLRALHARRSIATPAGEEAPLGADVLDVLEAAAEHGHADVVAWVVEEALGGGEEALEVMCDEVVGGAAARSGNVALLRWLHARGCPWEDDCVTLAAAAGCEAAVAFLLEAGCPMPEDVGQPYIGAATHGDLATLAGLQRLHVPWCPEGGTFTECVELAMTNPRVLPVLRWLLGAGCPVDWDAATEVADEAEEGGGGGLFFWRHSNTRRKVREWLQEERRRREPRQERPRRAQQGAAAVAGTGLAGGMGMGMGMAGAAVAAGWGADPWAAMWVPPGMWPPPGLGPGGADAGPGGGW